MHGIVDEKTDVYAYGVLLLELVTARKALDSSQQSLVMWVSLEKFRLLPTKTELSRRDLSFSLRRSRCSQRTVSRSSWTRASTARTTRSRWSAWSWQLRCALTNLRSIALIWARHVLLTHAIDRFIWIIFDCEKFVDAIRGGVFKKNQITEPNRTIEPKWVKQKITRWSTSPLVRFILS